MVTLPLGELSPLEQELARLLVKHEGIKALPYRDTVGKLTIGIGRNLEDVGLSTEECVHLLKNDIKTTQSDAREFLWFGELEDGRKLVVLSMIFNMGVKKFRGFRKFIAAMEDKNYALAADEMMSSLWAKQVGARALELSDLMREP